MNIGLISSLTDAGNPFFSLCVYQLICLSAGYLHQLSGSRGHI